jgi:quercetin dioxygenase-like cupin family protein
METGVSPEIGQRLRAMRRERRYSLAEVAAATAISKSFLTLVEGGKSDITITRLMRITQFYGVAIADVLPDTATDGDLVVRSDERQRVYSPSERMNVFLLSKHPERVISPVMSVLDPGGESEPSTHDGEEFVHVIEGELELEIGDEKMRLEAGDSIHFSAASLHTYRNPGSGEVSFLSISTPAIF